MTAVRRRPPRIKSGFATLRDLVSYGLGGTILVWEVFGPGDPNTVVILAGMALLGLPLALGGRTSSSPSRPDEQSQDTNRSDDST